MPRVKRGVTARARHKKWVLLAKGQEGVRSRLFRRAHDAMTHSFVYAYRDRRDRKGQFRRLWIVRINAAARLHGLKYNHLVNGLNRAGVAVNRKVLADMAVNDSAGFARLAEVAKAALAS